ncbi:hypothetical protein D3C75_1222150 [compost metagenome]
MHRDLLSLNIYVEHNVVNDRNQDVLTFSRLHDPYIIGPGLQNFCNFANRLGCIFISIDVTADNLMEVIFIFRQLHQIITRHLQQAALILFNLIDVRVSL